MARTRARQRRMSVRETISFVGWHALMLTWLVAWLFGAWWVWPVIARLQLDVDLMSVVFWLVTGAVTWLVALMLGIRRYWTPA
jgi:hypothetical protein